jgi:hypothetical protein
MSESSVYASNPEAPPDSAFVAGELCLLVPGNGGRLLDARRKPIRIVDVVPDRGAFVVHIEAFEDAGAEWELSLDEIARFQFARDARRLCEEDAAALERSRARFDRELIIECDETTCRATQQRLEERRALVDAWLDDRAGGLDVDLPAQIERREGDPFLCGLLANFVADRGVSDLEQEFTATFVTNPRSGEVVKGHAIVLAEFGLCPYRGQAPRDPNLFAGLWSRARRAEHLLWRLAFTQELWRRVAPDDLALYRAAASDEPLQARRPESFISAIFSPAVAEAHFRGGPTTRSAVLWRQRLPLERLLVSFLETTAMNGRFHEAEAVLVADPASHTF